MQSLLAALAKWTVSDWLMLAYDIVTAVAACVAYFALRTIRGQGRVMQEQLEQMKASNEVARVNVNALLNTERPWLVVRLRYASPKVIVDIANEGRTPAAIVLAVGKYTFWATADLHNVSLPTHSEELVHRRILIPRETWPAFYEFDITSDRERFDKAVAGALRFVFFGTLKYIDTVGNDQLPLRETSYCYSFDVTKSQFAMCGLKETNRHT
jgi:hypothetical protein